MDSGNGTPGHWAIWGNTNERVVLENWKYQYNFPYEQENEMTIGHDEDDTYFARVGLAGNEKITLRIKLNKEQPFVGEGIVNMCSQLKKGEIVKTSVPWFTTGYSGGFTTLDIDTRQDPVLEMIKMVRPYFFTGKLKSIVLLY